MITDLITTAEVQQIRQLAIFQGEVTRDQVKRLAQSWLEQHRALDADDKRLNALDWTATRAEQAEAAIDRVRAIHQPLDAVHEQTGQMRQVCTGCGTDSGNWQPWPCPTTRALNENSR